MPIKVNYPRTSAIIARTVIQETLALYWRTYGIFNANQWQNQIVFEVCQSCILQTMQWNTNHKLELLLNVQSMRRRRR